MWKNSPVSVKYEKDAHKRKLVPFFCLMVYMYCGHDSTTSTIVRLQHRIMDINQQMSASRLKLNVDKTELIWTGTKYSVTVGNASFLSLQLSAEVVLPSQHVHLLGLVISWPWEACFKRQRNLLLPSPSTATHPVYRVPLQHSCTLSWHYG